MIDVTMAPASELTEAKAKFVVISNVLGGIRDYDRGGWLVGRPAHVKAFDAVIRSGTYSQASPLARSVSPGY